MRPWGLTYWLVEKEKEQQKNEGYTDHHNSSVVID